MRRTLPWDWYDGAIPENVVLDPTAYVETTFSFHLHRSRLDAAITYGAGAATYLATMFDTGPEGRVSLGRCVSITGARIIADSEVSLGDHTVVSWDVVIMDAYRAPRDVEARRRELRAVPERAPRVLGPDPDARPVAIAPNVWLGFGVCVLPGVTVGEGSVVGARSVVADDVPPYTVVAGNPARPIRKIDTPSRHAVV